MQNRLKMYFTNNESEEQKMIFEELIEKLKSADGYMLSISILNADKIEHSVITNHFRRDDMLPSHKETKELIVKELENVDNVENLNVE